MHIGENQDYDEYERMWWEFVPFTGKGHSEMFYFYFLPQKWPAYSRNGQGIAQPLLLHGEGINSSRSIVYNLPFSHGITE